MSFPDHTTGKYYARSEKLAKEFPYRFRDVLKDAVEKRYNADRMHYADEGVIDRIHISSLLYCMREQVLAHIEKKKLDERSLGNFVRGRSIGDLIETAVLQESPTNQFTSQHNIVYDVLSATPDLIDFQNKVVIEIKSYARPYIKEPVETHVQQLKIYMSLLGFQYGILQYMLLVNDNNNDKQWMFVDFYYKMNKSQHNLYLSKYIKRAKQQIKMLNLGNAYDCEYVRFDTSKNWLCNTCLYKKPCDDLIDKERSAKLGEISS